ncbi:hypothetical protein MNB_SM-7-1096 [hydrothermal vent metagenome]|uniref:Permease n=1 Tax=hydrothermal vent metagenome TaxID=652676 RepID=A0A1W1BAC4_9ZZZZ
MSRQKRKPNKTGIVMLIGVILLYITLALINPDKTLQALIEGLKVLKIVIPIILVVFFLMALLDVSVDEKKVSKHFGYESGIKGWFLAIFAAVLSHGPAYVWYPLLQNLREHGAKDSLIFAFLYARSIKLPWLPLIISYFGWIFTGVFSFYIIVAAILQGLIVEVLERRKKF